MFTGLIEEIGFLESIRTEKHSAILSLGASTVTEGAKLGDSIAVNGVCLTVTAFTKTGFSADIMPETLKRSNLGKLTKGSPVNLERAMAAEGRFGGHMVSGHIDGIGKIIAKAQEGIALRLTIATEPPLLAQMIDKGSIIIDGVSLTIISVTETDFSVGIIPHTGQKTILLHKKIGDTVNLETDLIAKYIQKFMTATPQSEQPKGITADFLTQNGF